jgi:hypothetical protein
MYPVKIAPCAQIGSSLAPLAFVASTDPPPPTCAVPHGYHMNVTATNHASPTPEWLCIFTFKLKHCSKTPGKLPGCPPHKQLESLLTIDGFVV